MLILALTGIGFLEIMQDGYGFLRSSVVGYAGYKFNDATNINYRLEFFDDKDGVAAFGSFGGANVFSNTMSLNYKVGNLTFIPEVRFDFASEKIYPTENNASKTNGSILFATTYSF